MKWTTVTVADLVERLAFQRSIDDIIPECAAIYAWRRNLRVPRAAMASPAAFQSWVGHVVRVPIATLKKKELSHYLVVEALSLGGQTLSLEKEETLSALARSPKGRAFVAAFLESMAPMLPSIYVGEATNLLARVKEHLSGASGLKESLDNDLGIDWNELDLHYCEVPSASGPEAKALRTMLEMLATRLTLAPCVRRAG